MRFSLVALLLALALCAVRPAWASLPFYNPDLGYTIWLSTDWTETPPALLSRFDTLRDGVPAQDGGWTAGYAMGDAGRTCLLVSTILGRVVSRADMANFNQFVIRGLQRGGRSCPARLRSANFLSATPMLRLELDLGQDLVSVVHIVYTRTGMLKFTGIAPRGDRQGVRAIDAAVATLHLDHGLAR
ncbi:MAG: hypothetical protein V3571_10215 [Pseudodesulfovibrio sp.]